MAASSHWSCIDEADLATGVGKEGHHPEETGQWHARNDQWNEGDKWEVRNEGSEGGTGIPQRQELETARMESLPPVEGSD